MDGRVLIVEDDYLIAERISGLLRDGGYEVAGVATRTASAEEVMNGGGADLAIVSVMLEEDVDGIRTATKLHKDHGVKILITTGFPDAFVRRHLNQTLTCAILKKPFSDQELLTAVSASLAESG